MHDRIMHGRIHADMRSPQECDRTTEAFRSKYISHKLRDRVK